MRPQLFVVSILQNLTIDISSAGEPKEIFAIPLRVALQLR